MHSGDLAESGTPAEISPPSSHRGYKTVLIHFAPHPPRISPGNKNLTPKWIGVTRLFVFAEGKFVPGLVAP